jgi:hypothetical protein
MTLQGLSGQPPASSVVCKVTSRQGRSGSCYSLNHLRACFRCHYTPYKVALAKLLCGHFVSIEHATAACCLPARCTMPYCMPRMICIESSGQAAAVLNA